MRVVVTERVEGSAGEHLWAMYERSFTFLATRAVGREVLHREEFMELLVDRRLVKYLAEDADGRTVGMACMTRHLEVVTWISPEYFAARWPDQAANGRVYYVIFVLLDPEHQGRGGFGRLLEPMARVAADHGGVIGFDVCDYNDETADIFLRSLRHSVEATRREVNGHTLDHTTYYALTFGSEAGRSATFDGRTINLDADVAGSGRPNR